MPEFLKRNNAPDLAYMYSPGAGNQDSVTKMPTVMFLGGFRSDMQGTKAVFLEAACRARAQGFIRFDYRGHGQSEGVFEDACITDWYQDAVDILDECTSGPVIMVGSSMGGWISLLTAIKNPERVQALVGLAAAPNFTLWMEEGMNEEQQSELKTQGFFELPNDYDEPYVITAKLLEDGRQNAILGQKMEISCPVRLIQGKKDADVPWQTAEQIKTDITGEGVEIIYIEEGDHRLSSPNELKILDKVITELSGI